MDVGDVNGASLGFLGREAVGELDCFDGVKVVVGGVVVGGLLSNKLGLVDDDIDGESVVKEGFCVRIKEGKDDESGTLDGPELDELLGGEVAVLDGDEDDEDGTKDVNVDGEFDGDCDGEKLGTSEIKLDGLSVCLDVINPISSKSEYKEEQNPSILLYSLSSKPTFSPC